MYVELLFKTNCVELSLLYNNNSANVKTSMKQSQVPIRKNVRNVCRTSYLCMHVNSFAKILVFLSLISKIISSK